MGMIQEFKAFALKGNVVDMAVGVIIGVAFGAVVSSMVSDLMMPLIGLATGGISFADKFYALDGQTYASVEAAKEAGASVLHYGAFLDKIINFVIVAFCLFLVIKAMNAAKRKEPSAAPVAALPPRQEVLLEEIRDLLRQR
jgi:large conductance mechanosensitive channel